MRTSLTTSANTSHIVAQQYFPFSPRHSEMDSSTTSTLTGSMTSILLSLKALNNGLIEVHASCIRIN